MFAHEMIAEGWIASPVVTERLEPRRIRVQPFPSGVGYLPDRRLFVVVRGLAIKFSYRLPPWMSRLSRRTPADGEQTRMLTKTQCTLGLIVATDRGHYHSPDTKPVGTLNHTKGWDQIQHGMWQRTLHSGSEPWLQYAHTPPFALSVVPHLRR
jgi:hypothetical protein